MKKIPSPEQEQKMNSAQAREVSEPGADSEDAMAGLQASQRIFGIGAACSCSGGLLRLR